MHCEHAYMIINPRAGQDMTKLANVFTILSAAGWDVDNALVEYSGHARALAMKAAKREYDVIIGHGGDGTTNELVNAIMQSEEHKSGIAVLPGGTANQWPHEIGIPIDPVHAALALINSDVRKVDVGRMTVERISFPGNNEQAARTIGKGKKQKKNNKPVYYFLLTTGFGIDAAVISHTSKTLKEHIGRLAFDVAAAKELPTQHRFEVEICEADDGHASKTLWQGKALQLIISNTRLYADAIDITPNAYIDDGLLDICVITANSPFTKLQQMSSLVLHHKLDSNSTTYVQSGHFTITLPASIELQLDGSALELSELLNEEEVESLKQVTDPASVMITYRFDVLQQALQVAIPRTYDNALFAAPHTHEEPTLIKHEKYNKHEVPISHEQVETLRQESKLVTVMGVALNSDESRTYIIAGTIRKQSTGDIKPVAVRITPNTKIYQSTGKAVEAATVEALQSETVVAVHGKENKRGVIQADTVIYI